MKRLNFNHLYLFFKVAQVESVKRAAIAARTSSSRVSEAITRLSAYLSVDLVESGNRTIKLTDDGTKLYAHIKQPMGELEKVWTEKEGRKKKHD